MSTTASGFSEDQSQRRGQVSPTSGPISPLASTAPHGVGYSRQLQLKPRRRRCQLFRGLCEVGLSRRPFATRLVLIQLLWVICGTERSVQLSLLCMCSLRWAWSTSPRRRRGGSSGSATRRAFGTGVSFRLSENVLS